MQPPMFRAPVGMARVKASGSTPGRCRLDLSLPAGTQPARGCHGGRVRRARLLYELYGALIVGIKNREEWHPALPP